MMVRGVDYNEALVCNLGTRVYGHGLEHLLSLRENIHRAQKKKMGMLRRRKNKINYGKSVSVNQEAKKKRKKNIKNP